MLRGALTAAALTLLLGAAQVRAESTVGALMEAKDDYYKTMGKVFQAELRKKSSGTTVIVKTPPRNKMARCNSARRFAALLSSLLSSRCAKFSKFQAFISSTTLRNATLSKI